MNRLPPGPFPTTLLGAPSRSPPAAPEEVTGARGHGPRPKTPRIPASPRRSHDQGSIQRVRRLDEKSAASAGTTDGRGASKKRLWRASRYPFRDWRPRRNVSAGPTAPRETPGMARSPLQFEAEGTRTPVLHPVVRQQQRRDGSTPQSEGQLLRNEGSFQPLTTTQTLAGNPKATASRGRMRRATPQRKPRQDQGRTRGRGSRYLLERGPEAQEDKGHDRNVVHPGCSVENHPGSRARGR